MTSTERNEKTITNRYGDKHNQRDAKTTVLPWSPVSPFISAFVYKARNEKCERVMINTRGTSLYLIITNTNRPESATWPS